MANREDIRGLHYAALGEFLREQETDLIRLSLTEIDILIAPLLLPAEARNPSFWANSAGHHRTRRGQWLDAGYKAYLEPAQDTVRFERSVGEDAHWTRDELRACVVAYRLLLEAQQAGVAENKAKLRRAVVAKAMPTRSEGSYEFRMQNISAVLDDLGEEIVRGYLPRRNVGSVKAVIVELINELWGRETKLEAPTVDDNELATRVLAAREKLKKGKTGPPPMGSPGSARVTGTVSRFPRDPQVIAYALQEADGVCEACDTRAPFSRADGEPYLEVHHVRWLADGGPDSWDNAVGVCPNCHRRLHHAADREILRRELVKKVARVANHPRRPVRLVRTGE
jgi:5-methylcytosine-specific restriction protein A